MAIKLTSAQFRSSMTLFALVSGNGMLLHEVLDRYCEGREDSSTLDFLGIRLPH